MTDQEKMRTRLAGIGIGLDMAGYHDDAQCVRDALALLREQEPVPFDEIGYQPVCGVCHEVLDVTDEYCRCCGRKVRWKRD